MYMRLQAEGHEVRAACEPEAHEMLRGLVTHVPDWQSELAWAREGIIICETAHDGGATKTICAAAVTE